jgi:hypothetical protein
MAALAGVAHFFRGGPAKLMARVGEEFPFACPGRGGDIRLIAFITDPGPIRKILTHLGEPLEPPPQPLTPKKKRHRFPHAALSVAYPIHARHAARYPHDEQKTPSRGCVCRGRQIGVPTYGREPLKQHERSNSEDLMSDKPQFWILRGTGIVFAVIVGVCSWVLIEVPLAIKKVLDDFGTEVPLPLWVLSKVGTWLFVAEVLALIVAAFLFANPKSSVRNLLIGWGLLTVVAVLLSVMGLATCTAHGLLRVIEDLS